MRKQVLAVAVVGVVALALAGSLAWAAALVTVDVPFIFAVNDKQLPAGRYEIFLEENTRLVVRGTGGVAQALIIERLADMGGKEPKVVFDKVEGKSLLSEVHIPGQDGYLVGIAKGKETHEVLTGKM